MELYELKPLRWRPAKAVPHYLVATLVDGFAIIRPSGNGSCEMTVKLGERYHGSDHASVEAAKESARQLHLKAMKRFVRPAEAP